MIGGGAAEQGYLDSSVKSCSLSPVLGGHRRTTE
jgi:hypothetical protein